MAEYDPKTGKVRPTWTVRFTPWTVIFGCLVAGVVCAAVLLFTMLTGPGIDNLADSSSVLKGAIFILGACLMVFLFLGPTLAWGLGFALREQTNQNWHVIAFGMLGLFVGLSLGNFVGGYLEIQQFGTVVAPAAGIGAAIGRWSVSKHAKI